MEAVVSFADRTITQSRVHAFKDKIRMVLDVKNMSETEWGVYTWSPEIPTCTTSNSVYGIRENSLIRRFHISECVKSVLTDKTFFSTEHLFIKDLFWIRLLERHPFNTAR